MEGLGMAGTSHLQTGGQRRTVGGSVYGQVDNWHGTEQLQPSSLSTMATTGPTRSVYGYTQDTGSPQYQQAHQEYVPTSPNERKDVTAGKSPMGLLNEICARSKVRPTVNITECSNPTGPTPIFECCISAGEHREASGKGRTKKEAQHEAAKALLLKIDPRVEHFFTQTSYKQATVTPPQVKVKPENGQETNWNPVGLLNEFCSKAGLRPPLFEEVYDESKRPGDANFKCRCRISEMATGYGEGTNKKMAKKAAAGNLLEKIKELRAQPATVAPQMFPESEVEEVINKLNALALKEVTKTQLQLGRTEAVPRQPSPPKKLADVAEEVKKLNGSKLESLIQLKVADFQKADHFSLLDEIATELNFELECKDFPPLDEPKHESIVSLVIGDCRSVFIGSGVNTILARKSAAFSALRYLRLLRRPT